MNNVKKIKYNFKKIIMEQQQKHSTEWDKIKFHLKPNPSKYPESKWDPGHPDFMHHMEGAYWDQKGLDDARLIDYHESTDNGEELVNSLIYKHFPEYIKDDPDMEMIGINGTKYELETLNGWDNFIQDLKQIPAWESRL